MFVPSVVSSHLSWILLACLKRKPNFRTHCYNNTEFQNHILLPWTCYQIPTLPFFWFWCPFPQIVILCLHSFSSLLCLRFSHYMWLPLLALWFWASCRCPRQERHHIRARQDLPFRWVRFPGLPLPTPERNVWFHGTKKRSTEERSSPQAL